MKKIFILLGICLSVGIVHAAAADWTAYQLPDATAANSLTLKGLTASLYCTTLSTTSFATTTILNDGNAKGNYISVAGINLGDVNKGTDLTFYFTIIGTDADNQTWEYTSTSVTVNTGGGVGNVAATWTNTLANTSSNWVKTSNVPEPTSGLLLLCGLAGLALRRKRA